MVAWDLVAAMEMLKTSQILYNVGQKKHQDNLKVFGFSSWSDELSCAEMGKTVTGVRFFGRVEQEFCWDMSNLIFFISYLTDILKYTT